MEFVVIIINAYTFKIEDKFVHPIHESAGAMNSWLEAEKRAKKLIRNRGRIFTINLRRTGTEEMEKEIDESKQTEKKTHEGMYFESVLTQLSTKPKEKKE